MTTPVRAQIKTWVSASRLRTLPLAWSSISMGAFLSIYLGAFRWDVYILSLLTATLLQILSNLANDYGDHIHGADYIGRTGPKRAVQSGAISKKSMRKSLIVLTFLCLISGVSLLWVALDHNTWEILLFLALGLLSTLAAIAYTMGKRPYGYIGLGDLSVFIFFGPVGVLGSLYLFTHQLSIHDLWPAISCGTLSVAVLNINNIRDIKSDGPAGKHSIPVRIGRKKAILYHWALLCVSLFGAVAYTFMHYRSYTQFLFLIAVPLLVINGISVAREPYNKLDPTLRQMVLTTLVFVLSFGIGILW